MLILYLLRKKRIFLGLKMGFDGFLPGFRRIFEVYCEVIIFWKILGTKDSFMIFETDF